MSAEELEHYIKRALGSGRSEAEVYQELIQAGWSKKLIEDSFEFLRTKNLKKNPSKSIEIEMDDISSSSIVLEHTHHQKQIHLDPADGASHSSKGKDKFQQDLARQLASIRKQEALFAGSEGRILDNKTRNRRMLKAIGIFALFVLATKYLGAC